jgi:hypothetical protein
LEEMGSTQAVLGGPPRKEISLFEFADSMSLPLLPAATDLGTTWCVDLIAMLSGEVRRARSKSGKKEGRK